LDSFAEARIIPYQAPQKQYRIIGGTPVESGRYPYLVTLINKISDTVMYQVCGGILIAPQWVLSAAHCVGKVNSAQVGRSDLTDTQTKFESFDIKQTVQHSFERSSYDYDFVLFQLDAPSQFPWAKLNYDPNIPEANGVLTVIGWGVTEKGESSAVAIEAGVAYIENSDCGTMYRNEMITSRMLCAASPGKDACQGDSGGPLLLKSSSADSDLVVGVVSW
jgi:trypsin